MKGPVAVIDAQDLARELDLMTSRDVCAIAGISYRQLDYWTRRGYIVPEIAAEGSGTSRLWAPSVLDEIWDLLRRIRECPFPHEHERNEAQNDDREVRQKMDPKERARVPTRPR